VAVEEQLMSKVERQFRITQLLEAQPIGSQAELVALLTEEGINATQATVSRDLVELGVVKVRGADGSRSFARPLAAPSSASPTEHLRRVLSEWVVEVACAGPLVVVKTPPGCAHVVASALDRGALSAALGTVAGDDTIFVAVDERVGGAVLAAQLREFAGLVRVPRGAPRGSRRTKKTTQRGR
jgi:transcriptional regulator of arginine metabolism